MRSLHNAAADRRIFMRLMSPLLMTVGSAAGFTALPLGILICLTFDERTVALSFLTRNILSPSYSVFITTPFCLLLCYMPPFVFLAVFFLLLNCDLHTFSFNQIHQDHCVGTVFLAITISGCLFGAKSRTLFGVITWELFDIVCSLNYLFCKMSSVSSSCYH